MLSVFDGKKGGLELVSRSVQKRVAVSLAGSYFFSWTLFLLFAFPLFPSLRLPHFVIRSFLSDNFSLSFIFFHIRFLPQYISIMAEPADGLIRKCII